MNFEAKFGELANQVPGLAFGGASLEVIHAEVVVFGTVSEDGSVWASPVLGEPGCGGWHSRPRLGAIGMLWAEVSWSERFAGLSGFHKLLLIPLLLAQFRRPSARGDWVLLGFLASSLLLFLVFPWIEPKLWFTHVTVGN